jgi:hypothetical protein
MNSGKTNKHLDDLVAAGNLLSYTYQNIDSEGKPTSERKGMCNSERLTLRFSNGNVLRIDICCSGALENTTMVFSSGEISEEE